MGRTLVSSTTQSHSSHSLVTTVRMWRRRVASRRQLARLDPRLLADAGISEAQRFAELSKPFWR
ncbi:DUF1127 domain-containing protein [Pseudomonas schmalbachii]|uniref:DUF1127 domain-containing protein n=1 Tax=Pseudomonas schmalbachii TaxID=2816993 RepID=A0ABS3TQC3_9PSED|nr:DUF1127 domain-containing protein [Pseudomonas schmalbachii]MBO3275871.1 DUF1127 domain-containing protein [Pseudomonas schmalbachii]